MPCVSSPGIGNMLPSLPRNAVPTAEPKNNLTSIIIDTSKFNDNQEAYDTIHAERARTLSKITPTYRLKSSSSHRLTSNVLIAVQTSHPAIAQGSSPSPAIQ